MVYAFMSSSYESKLILNNVFINKIFSFTNDLFEMEFDASLLVALNFFILQFYYHTFQTYHFNILSKLYPIKVTPELIILIRKYVAS